MFEEIKEITSQEITENGVCSAPDVLSGSPEENKKIFDKLCVDVVIPKINSVIRECRALETLLGENSQETKELEGVIKAFEDYVGDISGVKVAGDTLCDKINVFLESFMNSFYNISNQLGRPELLNFTASSVINALNYLHDYVYSTGIQQSLKLPKASAEYFMKIMRVLDMNQNKAKFYVCKGVFPSSSGLYVGKTAGRLYFEPNMTKERFAFFREKNINSFLKEGSYGESMNLISFIDSSNPNSRAYLQIRYNSLFGSYVLAFYKDGSYIPIWASDNFSDWGTEHKAGYSAGAYTDLFSGCTITEIKDNVSWLACAKEFNVEYYWEEFGASSTITTDKTGRYTTITFKNGDDVKSVVVEDGINGYTPIKGQDYFTETDIEEISTAVEEGLKDQILASSVIVPEFVSSKEECVDENKLYVLPDGFIYRYSLREVTDIINIAEYGSGLLLNSRLSSTGALKPCNGIFVTDYVDVVLSSPYYIKISGIELNDIYETACHITVYDKDKNRLGAVFKSKSSLYPVDGVYTIDLYEMISNKYSGVEYVRLTLGVREEALSLEDEDMKNLFIEFVPKSEAKFAYTVWNTNQAFIPADYGELISDLSDGVSKNANDIHVISQTIKKQGLDISAYPTYWDGAVAQTVAKIQAKQHEFGRNGVTFAFFADNHQRLGDAGALIWDIMQKCSIPFAFFGGDSVSSGYINSKEDMISQEANFAKMMNCIPAERFCRAIGNHDGYYLTIDGEKYHCSWEEKYSTFLAPISVSQNKTFGGDGTYYYVDDKASKTRFIVLNSVWFDFATNEDGTANNKDNLGFGEEQLCWLCDVLASTDEDYQVVFLAHSPVSNNGHSNLRDAHIVQGIVNSFITGGAYNGEYTGSVNPKNNVSVNVSFTGGGNVVGWFSGHVHQDMINQSDAQTGNELLFKAVTITSDANISYDDNEADRDMNGDTSHAIDFVTVNRKTGEVYIARLGIGSDREYNYMEV